MLQSGNVEHLRFMSGFIQKSFDIIPINEMPFPNKKGGNFKHEHKKNAYIEISYGFDADVLVCRSRSGS